MTTEGFYNNITFVSNSGCICVFGVSALWSCFQAFRQKGIQLLFSALVVLFDVQMISRGLALNMLSQGTHDEWEMIPNVFLSVTALQCHFICLLSYWRTQTKNFMFCSVVFFPIQRCQRLNSAKCAWLRKEWDFRKWLCTEAPMRLLWPCPCVCGCRFMTNCDTGLNVTTAF